MFVYQWTKSARTLLQVLPTPFVPNSAANQHPPMSTITNNQTGTSMFIMYSCVIVSMRINLHHGRVSGRVWCPRELTNAAKADHHQTWGQLMFRLMEMVTEMIMKPVLVEWSFESESAARGEKLLNSKLGASADFNENCVYDCESES